MDLVSVPGPHGDGLLHVGARGELGLVGDPGCPLQSREKAGEGIKSEMWVTTTRARKEFLCCKLSEEQSRRKANIVAQDTGNSALEADPRILPNKNKSLAKTIGAELTKTEKGYLCYFLRLV